VVCRWPVAMKSGLFDGGLLKLNTSDGGGQWL